MVPLIKNLLGSPVELGRIMGSNTSKPREREIPHFHRGSMKP
jgi:hypothetical protein